MEVIIDYIKYDVIGAIAYISGYDRRKKHIHTIRIPRYLDVKGKQVEVVGGRDGWMEGLSGCVLEVPNTMKIKGVSLLDYAGESDVVEGVTCRIYEAREGYKEKTPKSSPKTLKTNDWDKIIHILIQCFIWMIAMALMVLSVKYWRWWTLLSHIPIIWLTVSTSMSIADDFNTKDALKKALVWLLCLTSLFLSIVYLHWWTFVTAIPIMIVYFKTTIDD